MSMQKNYPVDKTQINCTILDWDYLFRMFLALFFSPEDYRKGEIVRMMYIHVPSACPALGIYGHITSLSFISLVWNNSIASSIWAKDTWDTWWVWDARLTSMLIIFFLYVGYLSFWSAFGNEARAENSAAVFAIFSAINIPAVKFSVNLLSTLHQPACILRRSGVAIGSSLLLPLIVMFMFYATFLVVWILNQYAVLGSFVSTQVNMLEKIGKNTFGHFKYLPAKTEERAMLCDLTNSKSNQLEHFTNVLETYATAHSFYD
ncbi:heme exporter protein C-like [Calliopsis andreniformis]|uniref:heme exporter protein C-like n=1 Tax=Calliopsis andreniformis TaxID=337506 RepID=UPI003FCDBB68